MTTDEALPALELWYTKDGLATFSKVEGAPEIFLDGGGSIFVNEATVTFEVDGTKFKTYIRHIPYFSAYLKERGTKRNDSDIEGCVKFGGFHAIYVLPEHTCDGVIEKLDELWEEKQAEANAIEEKAATLMQEAGVVYAGKCSCQSGQIYTKCCGRKQVLE